MKTNEEKKAILLKHYDINEICEIMGYWDGSNEDVSTPEMEELEKTNFDLFEQKMLDHAIINGNFEECIEKDYRFSL